ncbi:FG-GAP repeat domain-containing protein [Kaarinaea lacus]
MDAHKKRLSAVAGMLVMFSLTACSGGGGSNNDPNTSNTPKSSVEESLNTLGVDTTVTQRVDDDHDPLPDSYSPFGSIETVDKFDELLIVGVPLSSAFGVSNAVAMVEQVPDAGNVFATEMLFSPTAQQTPWALSVGQAPVSKRAISTADIDGDGLEEILVVYQLANDTAIYLQTIDDAESTFLFSTPVVIHQSTVDSLALETGDFDGDGHVDAVLALTTGDTARLLFLHNDSSVLSLSGQQVELLAVRAADNLQLAVSAGNIDYDREDELAVVLNEFYQAASGANRDSGFARYYVFDDGNHDYAELASNTVEGVGVDAVRTAINADVVIADIDGDNVGEVVFGGLTNFAPTNQCEYGYLLLALDDQKREFAPLGSHYVQPFQASDCSASATLSLRSFHINALDIDNDGADEIQANQLVFEDFRAAQGWQPLYEIPLPSLFSVDADGKLTGPSTANNTVIVTGDITADKHDNIMIYSQHGQVEIWGIDTLADEWALLNTIAMQVTDSNVDYRPILVAANVDHDSLALQYSAGEYKLVFTEPVVIAALAAAPCGNDLGQDLDACRTGFGTAESDTIATEDSWSMTAGVSLGFSTSFSVGGVEVSDFEAIASVKAAYSKKTTSSYTLTKRVEYESGPIEDTVIFTSIPYDQYTYKILSHPDPKYIGVDIVLSLPREPIKVQVERSFYNNNVVEDGIQIDSSILKHTRGDPWSYPTAGEKDQLLARYDGFETDQVDVGEGEGSVGVGINIYNETGSETAYGIEAELEVQATAGVVVGGFSIGGGTEHALQLSHGRESDYSGAVGNLSAEKFAQNAYSYGLFTYIYEHTKQPFEVINYWVD